MSFEMLFKRQEKITLDQVRELYPTRAPGVDWHEDGDELRLTAKRSASRLPKLLSFFYRIPADKSFVLDQFGTKVWVQCDGRTRARDIVSSLARETGWPEDRTERAVLQFFSMLSARKLISFSSDRPPRP